MIDVVKRRAPSIALIFGLFVLWELACIVFDVPQFVLPRPTEIVSVIWEFAGAIRPHAERTLFTTLVGFGIGVTLGVAIGLLIGSSRLAYDTAYPLLIGISSIPMIAMVPIFVLWFGYGIVPAILTAVILCVFPIIVNVAMGIATVEPELEDVMRTLKASKLDILWNVSLPRAMPYFFASLKVAITLAFVGSVVAETVASNRGIGNMMMIATSSFNVPLVFAGLLILAIMGVSLYATFALIEARALRWATRSQSGSI
ncbi:MAG: ABC transporter permease [Pseudomonadota bacterium]